MTNDKEMQQKIRKSLPSSLPRILSALQFSITGTVFFCLIIGIIGYLIKLPFIHDITFWVIVLCCGIICMLPFFYINNSRLGINELKRGMYTLTEATILGVNDSGILIETSEKKIALSNPLLLNITYEQLHTDKLKVVYIKTLSGKDFLTIL